MGEDELKKINLQLSRIKIREKNGRLYLRGRFPINGALVRKEIALNAKANKEGFRLAIAKAKEIESQLLFDKWELIEKQKLTVEKAIKDFTVDYWQKFEKTITREYNWHKNQGAYFAELPEDELFNKQFLQKAVTSFPSGSYAQKRFCQLIRPVAKFHHIEFDFLPYMKYKSPDINFKELPTDESIRLAYENEEYLPHKWTLGILATYGIRPHEFFRCDFAFEESPPVLYIWNNTKTSTRTAYPLMIKGVDFLNIPNQWSNFNFRVDPSSRANGQVSQNITAFFRKYPFTPYQLRHYFAVRGAIKGLSPVILSKWMGHGLDVHYKYYGSLIGDRESAKLWNENFNLDKY